MENEPLRCVVATRAYDRLARFRQRLLELPLVQVNQVRSVKELSRLVAAELPDIVVLDEWLEDGEGISVAEQIAREMPLLNSALVSNLPEDEFHEQTEGLGILMQLSSPPTAKDAEMLLAHLAQIRAIAEEPCSNDRRTG